MPTPCFAPGLAQPRVCVDPQPLHALPNELVSLSDLENAARVIAGFIQTVTAEADFRPGSSRAPERA